MGWPKGKPRPNQRVGRPLGSRNKSSEGIETLARGIIETPAYQQKLAERALNGQLAPAMETMLFHYLYGRPREQQTDDQAFMQDLLAVVLKHAGSHEARKEIREVIEAHTGTASIRAVA